MGRKGSLLSHSYLLAGKAEVSHSSWALTLTSAALYTAGTVGGKDGGVIVNS